MATKTVLINRAPALALLASVVAERLGFKHDEALGEFTVLRGLGTFGGSGESLVKRVVTNLSAVALSVKPERSVRTLRVGGGLITHGPGISVGLGEGHF
jgi:hypothetical protein